MDATADRVVVINEATKRLGGISRSTLYTWIDKDIIPPPREFGPRLRGWLESEFVRFLNERPVSKPGRFTPDVRKAQPKAKKPTTKRSPDDKEAGAGLSD